LNAAPHSHARANTLRGPEARERGVAGRAGVRGAQACEARGRRGARRENEPPQGADAQWCGRGGRGAELPLGQGRGGHGAEPPPPPEQGHGGRGPPRTRARGAHGPRRGRVTGRRRGRAGKKKGEGEGKRERERERGEELTSGSKSGDHRLQNLGHHGERERGGGEEVAVWEN
jgi:hypothetical protein